MTIDGADTTMWTWAAKVFVHGAGAVIPPGDAKWIYLFLAVLVIAAVVGVDPFYQEAPPDRDRPDD